MKRSHTLFYTVFLFIIAQLTWFALVGLWIYWYVTNHLLLQRVEDKLTLQITTGSTNTFALVSGLVLLILLSLSMSIIFIYLTRQMSVTRQYDNFIANVTHELKSPLSSIQLYLETLKKREIQRDKQAEFIGLMLNDVDRLNHLINSILYLTSLEKSKSGKIVSHDYDIYEVDRVIVEVIEEARNEANFPKEYIEINGTVSGQCVIDRDWFKMVFHNLIDNARKYSPGVPHVKIDLSQARQHFIIEFSDDGIGINQSDQKIIFNKFQRIYNPEVPNVKGTGLGLYWVKEIVRYHGGKITVHSEGQNKGTTFRILLPIYHESKKRYINSLLRRSGKKIKRSSA